jgi:transcriptional regulator with XRE-family HTH domain
MTGTPPATKGSERIMGRGRKPNLERRHQAAALRERGWTLAVIGQHLGVSGSMVAYLLQAGRSAGKASPLARRMVVCCACGGAIHAGSVLGRDEGAPDCVACATRRPGATLGHRLQALRLAAGLSRGDLSRRARVGSSRIGDYEHGRKKPHLSTTARLARALGVSLGALERGRPRPEAT